MCIFIALHKKNTPFVNLNDLYSYQKKIVLNTMEHLLSSNYLTQRRNYLLSEVLSSNLNTKFLLVKQKGYYMRRGIRKLKTFKSDFELNFSLFSIFLGQLQSSIKAF